MRKKVSKTIQGTTGRNGITQEIHEKIPVEMVSFLRKNPTRASTEQKVPSSLQRVGWQTQNDG